MNPSDWSSKNYFVNWWGRWIPPPVHAAIDVAACCRPSAQLTGKAVGMRRGNFLPRAHDLLLLLIIPIISPFHVYFQQAIKHIAVLFATCYLMCFAQLYKQNF